MAYYDALIAAWNGATQPPAGVTGTALLAGDAAAQKIAKVNAWTVVATAIPMIVPTYKIYNAVVPSEFQALTAANQQLIRDIFGMGTVDASVGTNVRSVILQVFGVGTVTRTNLTALAAPYDSPKQPWWQANGYQSQFHIDDATNAGLV
jgi:hypothetical protein